MQARQQNYSSTTLRHERSAVTINYRPLAVFCRNTEFYLFLLETPFVAATPFFAAMRACSVYEALPGRPAGAGAALLGRPGEQGQVLRLRVPLQHRQGASRNETSP